ncbi:MAG: hypothetical protein IPM98_06100 [Lewinellaceae bacterium]|nr:hypothetical protein [Lewinellaceae bacterium]
MEQRPNNRHGDEPLRRHLYGDDDGLERLLGDCHGNGHTTRRPGPEHERDTCFLQRRLKWDGHGECLGRYHAVRLFVEQWPNDGHGHESVRRHLHGDDNGRERLLGDCHSNGHTTRRPGPEHERDTCFLQRRLKRHGHGKCLGWHDAVRLFSATPVSCNGGSNGTATANASGGTMPYGYLWSDGQTTATATNLSAGTYTVTTTDANGCSAIATATVTQPAALGLSTSATPVSCNGGSNGTATANASGGTMPYGYLWSNGQTTATAVNLSAGTYTVTTTDDNGCSAIATATVTQPAALGLSTSATPVSCNGGSNGTATANASGGTMPYGYLWSDGQTTATATNLSAGTYTVTTTDSNGCSAIATATITQPVALGLSTSATPVSCNGGSNGTATANASGGTMPYGYLWSDGQTTATATNLTAGTYTVTTTDANGCSAIATATITQPVALGLSTSVTNVLCSSDMDGSIELVIDGGVTPYGYLWSDGQTTSMATGLGIGAYTVTVTDDNGCSATTSATVVAESGPDALAVVVAQVFLQGPYVGATQLMHDNLRVQGLIPLTEPYTGMMSFVHVGGGGGEQTTSAVLAISGSDAIVDWVFLELRSAVNPAQVLATRSALVQRDGDVVDVDGVSQVTFNVGAEMEYYLVVRHRNHLGVQSGDVLYFPACAAAAINFQNLPPEGFYNFNGLSPAQRLISGKYVLWAANGRIDPQLKYNGSNNDRNAILSVVGLLTPNAVVSGYRLQDYNMDGLVKYNGSANDRNVLLGNVGILTPSAVVEEQVAR